MHIRVECPCGQRYEFECEPINGKLPGPVQCPVCGREGTESANDCAATQLAASVAPPAVPLARPIPTRATGATSSAPQRLASSASTRAAAGAGAGALLRGALGAVGGGLAGMLGWYLITIGTGYEIGYAAVGVGALVGFGALKLAGTGSHALGIIAGACALFAIIGGQYLAAKYEFDRSLTALLDTRYEQRMSFARSALAARSDDELRALVAPSASAAGKNIEPGSITDEQLALFRMKRLPELQAFTEGRPTKPAFIASARARIETSKVTLRLLKGSLRIFTLLWLIFGVSGAYRIAVRPN